MRHKLILDDNYKLFENGTIQNQLTGNFLTPSQSKPYGITVSESGKKRFLSFPRLMYESFYGPIFDMEVHLFKAELKDKFSLYNLYLVEKGMRYVISDNFKIGEFEFDGTTYFDIPDFKGYKISKTGNVLSFITSKREDKIHLLKIRGEHKGVDLSKMDGSKIKTYYLNTLLIKTFSV